MAAMASLVQDVWLGWEPRLRGRRLAPWEEPRVRLLLHLDIGQALEDPAVARLLETLGARLEVVTWEPRGQGGSAGRLGPEVLEDARRLAADGAARWGALPLVLGGLGLGGWIALAAASLPGVRGAFAVAPSLAGAGPEPASPLRAALLAALARPPLDVPLLVLEGRERPPAEAEAVAQWEAREPHASRFEVGGGDGALLLPPWPAAVAAWAEAVGTGSGAAR
jgi:hypothetical protein